MTTHSIRYACLIWAFFLLAPLAAPAQDFVTSPVRQFGFFRFDTLVMAPDGNHAVVGGRNARLIRLDTGALVRQYLGHQYDVMAVAISPDGTRVATGDAAGMTKIWNRATGRELRSFPIIKGQIHALAFSPNGAGLLAGTTESAARLWDADTGEQIQFYSGHQGNVRAVAFSPDGTRVLTGSDDGTAKLWNAETAALIRTYDEHFAAVNAVDFSPDGTRILTGSDDTAALLWNVETGQLIHELLGHFDNVYDVAFSPDGLRAVTASRDQEAILWDLVEGVAIRNLIGHTNVIQSAVFFPNGANILTGSYDGTARVWETASGEELRSFTAPASPVYSIAVSPDGNELIVGYDNNSMILWNVTSAEMLRTYTGHTNSVSSVKFSPDGTRLLSGAFDDTAKIWNKDTGAVIHTLSGHTGIIQMTAFAPDGTRVATASTDQSARLWNAATGAEIRAFTGHANSVFAVDISPDGTRLLTGSGDATARLWNIETGAEVGMLSGHAAPIFGAAFSPDGTRAVTGSVDTTGRIWNTATGTSLRTLSGHFDQVYTVAYSPVGDSVLTGSPDLTARLWDAETGQPVRVFSGHSDTLYAVAYSPDGEHVFTGSLDGTVLMWRTDGTAGEGEGEGEPEPLELYVSPSGSDLPGNGTAQAPLRSIPYAVSRAAFDATEANPATILLGPGVYETVVVLAPYVSMAGPDPANPAAAIIRPTRALLDESGNIVVDGAEGSSLRNLSIELPLDAAASAVLLRINNVAMNVENCIFNGRDVSNSIGISILGQNSSPTRIAASRIERLSEGVRAVETNAVITRNLLRNIQDNALVIRLAGKDTAVKRVKGASTTPLLGDINDTENTGDNRFENVGNLYVLNLNPEVTLAQANRWFDPDGDGVDTPDDPDTYPEVAAKISGSVNFTPYLAAGNVLSASLAITVERSNDRARVTNASITVPRSGFASFTQNQNGVYALPAIFPGSYPVEVTAPGFGTFTGDVQLLAGAQASTIVTLRSSATDTTPPVITRRGPAAITIACGDAYNDEGATATDDVDGDISGAISVQGLPLPQNRSGVFTITYRVQDAAGNNAAPVTRSVTITDTEAPTIALNGAAEIALMTGQTFNDPGATATDGCEGDITARIAVTGLPNTSRPGVSTVTYRIVDGAGNEATATRTVTVTGEPKGCAGCGPGGAAPPDAGDAVVLLVALAALAAARRGRAVSEYR